MKKMTSIGSTRPEQFLYTDFSALCPSDNTKQSITRILSYIKNMLKIRNYVFFCPRDALQLYQLEPVFFNAKFNAHSGQQLWAKIMPSNKKQQKQSDDQQEGPLSNIEQRGTQREIISFLTKIIVALVNQKNQCAEKKKFDQFAELKRLIQWLQDRIIEVQKLVRQKIKQSQLKKKQSLRYQREKHFRQKEENSKLILQQNKQLLEKTLAYQHSKEKKFFQSISNQKVKESLYKFRPSYKLKQAKDMSLLAKLAPYKNQKKRPFQCKSLQNSLSKTIQYGKQIQENKIQQYHLTNRKKLNNRQNIQFDHHMSKAQFQNIKYLSKLEMKRDQQKKSQRIQIQKLIKQNNRLTNERLESLKKSLKAYSIHSQSRQIREIIRKHHDTIQFVNDIGKIGQTQKHSQLDFTDTLAQQSGRFSERKNYQTVNLGVDTQWKQQQQKFRSQKSKKRYADLNIEKKILRRIKNENTQNQQEQEVGYRRLSSGRKSLIDLYDEELNPLA